MHDWFLNLSIHLADWDIAGHYGSPDLASHVCRSEFLGSGSLSPSISRRPSVHAHRIAHPFTQGSRPSPAASRNAKKGPSSLPRKTVPSAVIVGALQPLGKHMTRGPGGTPPVPLSTAARLDGIMETECFFGGKLRENTMQSKVLTVVQKGLQGPPSG
jgi:hypothetical protein